MIATTEVPWIDAWRDEPDDAELDRIVECRAVRLDDSRQLPYELAQIFGSAARKIFLCDPQSRQLLRMMLSAGRAHAKLNFPSVSHFDRLVAVKNPWVSQTDFSIGISGLSGVGKTQLMHAFCRLAASRTRLIDTETLANVQITPIWYATLKGASGIADVLAQFLNDDGRFSEDYSGSEKSQFDHHFRAKRIAKSLTERTCVRAYRDGIIMFCLDELQFGSKGSGVSWLTQLILKLTKFGPLVVYNTNFSLLHNLVDANHEVTRRLLSNVTEMLPFGVDNSDWRRFLGDVMSLLPDAWCFNVNEIGSKVLQYTFGIRDNVVSLLSEALITARTEFSGNQVTAMHLESAYRSASYCTRRNVVELLLSQRYLAKKRKDLFSPLTARQPAGQNLLGAPRSGTDSATLIPSERSTPEQSMKVVSLNEPKREYESRVLDKMHEEQMQAPVRREVEKIREHRITRAKSAVVVPLRKVDADKNLADIIGSAADLIDDQ